MGWYQRSHRLLVVFDISQKMMVSNWEPYISNASKKLGIGGFGKAAILYPVLRTTVTNLTRPCR